MVNCENCDCYYHITQKGREVPKCRWGRFSEGDIQYDDPTTEMECSYWKELGYYEAKGLRSVGGKVKE